MRSHQYSFLFPKGVHAWLATLSKHESRELHHWFVSKVKDNAVGLIGPIARFDAEAVAAICSVGYSNYSRKTRWQGLIDWLELDWLANREHLTPRELLLQMYPELENSSNSLVKFYASHLKPDALDSATAQEVVEWLQITGGCFCKFAVLSDHKLLDRIELAQKLNLPIALDGLWSWKISDLIIKLPSNILWLEEPIHCIDYSHLSFLSNVIPFGLGENANTSYDLRRVLWSKTLVPDVIMLGGPTKAIPALLSNCRDHDSIWLHGRELIPAVLVASILGFVNGVEYQLRYQPSRDIFFHTPITPYGGFIDANHPSNVICFDLNRRT